MPWLHGSDPELNGSEAGDLSECKQRLDASVEENRRNRRVIEDVNEQLARFRRRRMEEGRSSSAHLLRPSTSTFNFSTTNNLDIETTNGHREPSPTALSVSLVGLDGAGAGPQTPSTMMANTLVIPIRTELERPRHHRSSPTLILHDDHLISHWEDDALERIIHRLEQQAYRTSAFEEVISLLRNEAQNAHTTNAILREDVAELNRALAHVSALRRQDHLTFQEHNERYRRRTEVQNRRLLEIQQAFKAHRSQVEELRTSTKAELDRQLAEFTRANSLLQTTMRERRSRSAPRQIETVQDLVVKCERLMEKNTEMEKDKSRNILRLENLLKKAQDERDALQESLTRVSKMPELEQHRESRARSVSPDSSLGNVAAHLEIQRKIRTALSAKTSQLRELEGRAERAEREVDRLKKNLEKLEAETRECQEDKRMVEQREKNRNHEKNEVERTLKRVQERLRTVEEEKRMASEEMDRMQRNLTETLRSHKEFIEDLSRRHSDEIADRVARIEADAAERIAEMKAKLDRAYEERERERVEVEKSRGLGRETSGQLAAALKRCDEFASAIEQLERDKERMKGEEERLNEKIIESERMISELQLIIDERTESEHTLMERITQLSSVEVEVKDERRRRDEEMSGLKRKTAEHVEKEERVEMMNKTLKKKLSEAEEMLIGKEKTMKALRSTIAVLEQKLEEKTAENTDLLSELQSHVARYDATSKDLLAASEAFEELSRERDSLSDAYNSATSTNTSLESKLKLTYSQLEEKTIEESRLREEVEGLTSLFRKAEEDVRDRERQLEMARDQLAALEGNLKRQEISNKDERKRSEQKIRDDLQAIIDDLQEQIKILESEKEVITQTLDISGQKLEHIEELHEQLLDELNEAKKETASWKEKTEAIELQRRKERNELIEANAMDRDEWEKEREKTDRQRQQALTEQNEELRMVEEELRNARITVERLRKERDEAVDEIENTKRRIEEIRSEAEKQSEAFAHADAAHTQERHSLLAKLEEANLKSAREKSLLDTTNRRSAGLESELVATQKMLSEKSRLLLEVETSLDGLVERMRESEHRENELKDRLAMVEGELEESRRTVIALRGAEGEAKKRTIELEERLRGVERDLVSTKSALEESKRERSDSKTRMAQSTNQIRLVESTLAERTVELEAAKKELADAKEKERREKLKREEQKAKTEEVTRLNEQLRNSLTAMKEELSLVHKSLDDKSSSSRVAMDGVLGRYRELDSRLVELQAECDRLKTVLASTSSKLDRSEARREELERRLSSSEALRDEMNARISVYERTARNALHIARPSTSVKGASSYDLSQQGTYTSGLISQPSTTMKASNSTSDLRFGGDHRTVRFDSDASSVDITMRFLKERIDRLEADNSSLTTKLADHALCAARLSDAMSESERWQRRVKELEDEKKHLEGKIHSQRQLYLSNEESMASKDREGRGLRNKLSAMELRVRERESQVEELRTQIESLRTESDEMRMERKTLAERCRELEDILARVETERVKTEGRKEDFETALRRAEREAQTFAKRLEESETAHNQATRMIERLKIELEMERDSVMKLKREEEHWRDTANTANRTADEYKKAMVEERLAALQRSYDELNLKNEKVVDEAERLRKELRDATLRAASAVQKASDTERRLEEVADSRKQLHTRILAFERKEGEWSRIEKEMEEELKALRKDKLALTSEIEELKRRVSRMDVEKREIEVNRTRLEREVVALKKHIETMEDERARREISLREALAERKAIDKSLATMEKENAELYRSCSNLQAQIAQLEHEHGGSRGMAKVIKEHAEMEAKLLKIVQDKKQIESTNAQKEMNYNHKLKVLETQVAMMKEQLESERRRRFSEMKRADSSRKISAERNGRPFRA